MIANIENEVREELILAQASLISIDPSTRDN